MRIIILGAAVVGLGACAPTLRHPTAFGTDCAEFGADVTCVRVFYGSNRAFEATADGRAEVDVDRIAAGDSHQLRLGRADVWLPRLKADGTLRARGETPLLTGEPPRDPDLLERYVMITRITAQGQERFVSELGEAVQQTDGEPSILLFIHGFNVGFEPALISAAQLTVDLKEDERFDPGAPVLFSWPSQGSVTPWAYYGDQRLADAAVPHLTAFLDLLLDEIKPDRINIIAHSMGNRVLTQALERYAEQRLSEGRTDDVEFRIILAAADVERDLFGVVAGKLDRMEPNVTVYASDNDAALWVSRIMNLNGAPRLGQVDGDRPWIRDMPGYTTVDATSVASALFGLGHGYYSDNPFILNDIRCALADLPIGVRALDPARYDGRPDGQTYFQTRAGGQADDDNCALRRRNRPDAPGRSSDESPVTPPPVIVPSPPPPPRPPTPTAPPPPPQPSERSFILLFGTSVATLDGPGLAYLDEVVRYVLSSGATRIVVAGHTDSVGDAATNQRISLARARAVADRLIAMGLPASAIEVVGYGEARPVVAEAEGVAEPANRRVEIIVRR